MAVALLALTVVCWAGAFRATAIASEHAPGLIVSGFRAGPAALALVLVLRATGRRLPAARTWLWAAVTGLLMVTFVTQALVEAVDRAGAGNTAVLINTSPFFVALAGAVFLGERLSWSALTGLLVGFGGVVMMTAPKLGGGAGAGSLVAGTLIALAAAMAWGVGMLLIKWALRGEPGLDMLGFTAAQYAVGGPLLLAVALGAEGTHGTNWSSGELWGALAFLALGTSAIGSVAFFAALKRVSASRAAAWQFLVPVLAVLIEVVLGHAPSGIVLGGMVLAVGGVAAVNAATARGAPAATDPALGRLPRR